MQDGRLSKQENVIADLCQMKSKRKMNELWLWSMLRKGSKNVLLTREKVKFIIGDPISFKLLDWLQHTWIADEHFFSTLDSIKSYKRDPKATNYFTFNQTERTNLNSSLFCAASAQSLGCSSRPQLQLHRAGLVQLMRYQFKRVFFKSLSSSITKSGHFARGIKWTKI